MDMSFMAKFAVHRRRRRRGARPPLGRRRERRRRAGSPTPSGSTTTAGSRPTSPSPSSPTTGSSSSRPTPRTATSLGAARARPRAAAPWSVERRHRATSPSSTSRARCRATSLAALTDADLSTEAWPFRGVREIEVAGVPVTCARITYLGELGYELYVPADRAARAVRRAGGRRAACGRSGSRRWRRCGWRRPTATSATTSTTPTARSTSASASRSRGTPTSAARTRCCARKASFPSTQRLVQIRLSDPEPLLYHAEPVLRDGEVVGYVRAASYGWTLGAAVGLAFVERRRAGHQGLAGRRRAGRSTSPASGTTPRSRCGRCTTRPAPACAPRLRPPAQPRALNRVEV